MPTMVETRPATCPSCGRQTVVTCSCTDPAHCPKCAKVPEINPHVYVAVGERVRK